MNSTKDINRLRSKLLAQLNWGDANSWHSSMFEELSEDIFKQTQVRLSQTTLKRFLGTVSHDGAPSSTTLDTICQFLAYENWRAFRKPPKVTLASRLVPKGRSFYLVTGFLIAMVTVMLIANRRAIDPAESELIEFTSRPVANTYPNSVVFEFDLKNIRSDNLRIQQYWDPDKTVSITQDQKQATAIYYYPGYFRAKMVVNDKPLKQHDLFLRSNRWLGTIDYAPIPKYFKPTSSEQYLSFPQEILTEISSLQEPVISSYHYVDDLGDISADNFKLNVEVQNAIDDKWAVCQNASVFVLGTKSAIIIPLGKIGCSSDFYLMYSEHYYDGKQHDLSMFGTNLDTARPLEIEVINKQVLVKLDDIQVYESSYEESIGRLVGLRIKFLGIGEVKSLELQDHHGETIKL